MKFQMISSKDLEQYLGKADVLLLDLREYKEYQAGHIADAVWADWETLEEQIDVILEEHAGNVAIRWIILYCDRGNTSLLLARDLARSGYSVMSLNGGYKKWKRYLASASETNG